MTRTERSEYLQLLNKEWFCNEILNVDYIKNRGEVAFICPFHNDHHKSGYINLYDNGLFNCPACGTGGDFFKLIMNKMGISFKEAMNVVKGDSSITFSPAGKEVYDSNDEIKDVNPRSWEIGRRILIDNPGFRKPINDYGISNEIIDRFKIGIQLGQILRILIPIFVGDTLVSVKKHRITGNPINKTVCEKGSRVSLYSYNDMIAKDKLLLLEGEPDMLAAYSHGLDKYITPCCNTGGANTFLEEWIPIFSMKDVYICYDNDKAGIDGINKIRTMLEPSVNKIKIIGLPDGYNDMRHYLNNYENYFEILQEFCN